MVTIEVNNSTSRIIGLDRHHLKLLRHAYSYVDQSASKHSRFPVRVHVISKDGVFGSGLVNDIADKIRRVAQVVVVDLRQQPPESIRDYKVRFKRPLGLTPYEVQKQVVEWLRRDHKGVAILPTGVGKSIVIAMAINELKVPTLIITPNLNLKIQLTRDLTQLFGSQRVGMVSKTQKLKFISVANIQSLSNLPDNIFSSKHLLIIDEFHHQVADSYLEANEKKFNGIYYRLGLTATNFRSNADENIFLRAFSSNILIELTQEEAIDKGYIVRPSFKAFNVTHTPEELLALKEAKSYFDLRRALYNESPSYNKALCRVIARSLNEGRPTVVLFDQIEHIKYLCGLLVDYTAIEPVLVTGLTEDNQKRIEDFNAGKIPLLMGTGCLGEGVNTKPVRTLIIAAPGRAKAQFFQNVGRGLRNSTGKDQCDVWIPRVSGHTIFATHFHNRTSFCTEYGKYGKIEWVEV